jgi:hypothetical protein
LWTNFFILVDLARAGMSTQGGRRIPKSTL